MLEGYRREARGEWSLWLDQTLWREEWWALLERGGEDVSTSRHARTVRLGLSGVGGAFLKRYHPGDWPTRIKDILRPSKALRALRMSVVLAADGFHVARVLAAGERRRGWYLERAFVLTAAVEWPPLGALAEALGELPPDVRIARRRAALAGLGREVGHFHRLGYVHGDLVATNILGAEDPPVRFCFLDHDRSRRGLIVSRRHQQRRNLIQLNRLILPGITHADRLRVFVGYASARGWDRARWRREARWLARRTRARRLEIERLAMRRAEVAAPARRGGGVDG